MRLDICETVHSLCNNVMIGAVVDTSSIHSRYKFFPIKEGSLDICSRICLYKGVWRALDSDHYVI